MSGTGHAASGANRLAFCERPYGDNSLVVTFGKDRSQIKPATPERTADMAGRKPGFRHSEETRQKIQGALIVKRLYDHIMAPEDAMSASQVNAAKVLLNKVIPDLASVALTGEDGGPVQTSVTITFG